MRHEEGQTSYVNDSLTCLDNTAQKRKAKKSSGITRQKKLLDNNA